MFSLDQLDGDIFDETYKYIIVYNRQHGEIVSFYRYILCSNAIKSKHDIRLSTAKYFAFSDEFVEKILPFAIELGRSVVNKMAKDQENALAAVWIGLGILVYEYHQHPRDIQIDYFFGKFSIQWNVYNEDHRNMILYLFKKYFPPLYGTDGEIYVKPRFEFETTLDFTQASLKMNSGQYKADRKILLAHLGSLKMPKLAEAYANLKVNSFGTIFNDHLNSWETGTLSVLREIESSYIRRFVDGYMPTINRHLFA